MSMIARSGRSSRTRSISAEGVPDWPTTSKPERSSRPASPSRRRTSSSASTTCVRLVLTAPIMGYLDTMGTSARLAEPHAKDRVAPGQVAEEQAALRRVATLVAAGAPPAEVFDAVTAEVAALIPADGSALTRYEADGTFTPLSGWAIGRGHKYVGRRYERAGTVSGLIFETGRPGRVDNYAEAPGEALKAARELAWHSSVGAPITVECRLWGALVVVSKSEQPLPPETERRLAEFTELVATAIANSQAHDELARLAEEQAALRRVATLVAAGAPPEDVFEAVSAEV